MKCWKMMLPFFPPFHPLWLCLTLTVPKPNLSSLLRGGLRVSDASQNLNAEKQTHLHCKRLFRLSCNISRSDFLGE